jgi:hypothetical protein
VNAARTPGTLIIPRAFDCDQRLATIAPAPPDTHRFHIRRAGRLRMKRVVDEQRMPRSTSGIIVRGCSTLAP